MLFFAGLAAVSIDASFGDQPTNDEVGVSSRAGNTSRDVTTGGASAPTTAVGGPSGASDAPNLDGSAGGGSGVTDAGGGSGGTGSVGGATGASTPTPTGGRAVPGVSDKQIKIGFVLPVRSGTATQFGANGIVDPGPGPAKAVVAYVNAHGGIAGRTVVPVFFDYDTTTSTFSAESQAACAHFTDDDPVFVVSGWGFDREVLLSCLAAKRTPMVKDSFILYDRDIYTRYRGYLYVPSSMSGERLSVWIDQLAAAKFFAPTSKIGLVRFDTPEHQRASNNVIRPRLAAAGFRLTDEVAIKNFDSAAQLGDVGAATQNAVLRFNSRGIDRVLILDTSSPLTLFFTTNAEGQHYRPRYGLSSYNYADFVAHNAPAQQFEGSLGVGWAPAGDAFFIDRQNPAVTQCLDILAKGGVPAPTSGDAWSTQVRFCSHVFFLKQVLDRATQLSPQGMLDSAERLGSAFTSASTFATRLGPGRYDGAAAVRLFSFDGGCTCFHYTTGNIATP